MAALRRAGFIRLAQVPVHKAVYKNWTSGRAGLNKLPAGFLSGAALSFFACMAMQKCGLRVFCLIYLWFYL
jgi:hypothetical protein